MKLQLNVNMCIQMHQNPFAELFLKQLLGIGDRNVTVDETGCIKLPRDFCTIINLQD